MSRAEKLYYLQQTDSQLDQHSNRLREIQVILEDDQAIKEAREIFEATEKTLAQTQKDLRIAKNNVQDQRAKIKQSEDRLYSGKVSNPKELEDIQKEVAALKRYLEVIEERQLEVMMTLDDAQEEFDRAQELLDQAIAAGDTRNEALINEMNRIEANVDALQAKREKQISEVATDDMQLYEKLRRKRAGVAVASVQDRNCAACGSTLGTASYQQARSPSKITQCETCERILYAE
jgi:predicted  nucleic acid-binding Zn-ribbon protein